MRCKNCNINCILYKQINASGAVVVVERCPDCGRNPNKGHPFLPKAEGWESLPLFEDYSIGAEPCAVRGCTNIGTEYHHFSPRHIFEDADDWPTGYLCKEHHKEWHKRTRTGSYYGNH